MSTYAISTWLFGHVPADDAIHLMAANGFTEAELSAEWAPITAAWEQDPAGVCEQLAEAGITVPSVHSPRDGRMLDLADDHERLSSVQANLRYFDLMQACGVPEIIIHPVSGAAGDNDDEWAAVPHRSRASLEVLAEKAGNAGLSLAVENIGRNGRPGSTMVSILELIDGLGDHVGICMDIGHTQQAQLDLLDELSTALTAGKLLSLHLHDVDPEGTDHYIPGEGCIDFAPFLDMLEEHDYKGGRTLEIRVAPPEEVVARIRQTAAVRERWESL